MTIDIWVLNNPKLRLFIGYIPITVFVIPLLLSLFCGSYRLILLFPIFLIIVTIMQNFLKYNNIGTIFLKKDAIRIKTEKDEVYLPYSKINKIKFVFSTPKDEVFNRLPIPLSGFDNQIIIYTDTKEKYFIKCTYSTYKEIRTFVKENNEHKKIKVVKRFMVF